MWLSEYHSIEELFPLVKEWHSAKCPDWGLGINEKSISISDEQECLKIISDKQEFDGLPIWIQARIIW